MTGIMGFLLVWGILFAGMYAGTLAVACVAGMAFSDPGVRPRIARGLALACVAVGIALYVVTEGHKGSDPLWTFVLSFTFFAVLSLPCWLAYWTLHKMLLASQIPPGLGLTSSKL